MVIIIGKFKLESASDFDKIRGALIRRAVRSKADAGNITYEFSQSIDDPTEIWENEESLEAHLRVPDEEFSNLLATTRIVTATVSSYSASNERVLMER